MPVLRFLSKKEAEKFFDDTGVKVIDYLLKKVLFSQPENLPGQNIFNIQITKEFLEQWIVQGLGWKPIGAGSYPIDVYSPSDKIGVDVKFMSAKMDKNGDFTKSASGETSLGQKFKDSGRDLDQDFRDKNFDKILKGWKKVLSDKLEKAIGEYGLNKIYYFIFIRGAERISLAIAEVNSKSIKNIKAGKNTKTSLFINGFVDERYGNVKIYKSKKRMELRCYPKNIEEDGLFLEWDFEDLIEKGGVNLREIIKNKKDFKSYLRNKLNKIFNL